MADRWRNLSPLAKLFLTLFIFPALIGWLFLAFVILLFIALIITHGTINIK